MSLIGSSGSNVLAVLRLSIFSDNRGRSKPFDPRRIDLQNVPYKNVQLSLYPEPSGIHTSNHPFGKFCKMYPQLLKLSFRVN